MKHRLTVGICFFLVAIALLSLHLVIEGTASPANAQRRDIVVQAPFGTSQVPDMGDQHHKPRTPGTPQPTKRAQLCKKLELRRAELRAQEEKQKKLSADSATAASGAVRE